MNKRSRLCPSPERQHGLLFDAAIFVGNILLVDRFSAAGARLDEATIGVLLIVAVLTQILGAWLKRGMLRQRLGQAGGGERSGWAAGLMRLLLFLHCILFTTVALMACVMLGLSTQDTAQAPPGGDCWTMIALSLGGTATLMVWRASGGKEPAKNAAGEHRWPEFAADGLLWISATIVTTFFWDTLVATIEPARGVGMSPRGWVLLAAMSLLFVVFYLPERYLFLIEDYRSPLTWVQVCVAMLPVAGLILLG